MNIVKLYKNNLNTYAAKLIVDDGVEFFYVTAFNEIDAKKIAYEVYKKDINIFYIHIYLIPKVKWYKKLFCRHHKSVMYDSKIVNTGMNKMYYCLCLECGKEYTEIM